MSTLSKPPAVTLRPITDADQAFLRDLYASTRQGEFASLGLPAEQSEALMTMQFEAQTDSFRDQFPQADLELILDDGGIPIGRLSTSEREDEIRLIDIALLPEARGKGIGSHLLQDVLDRATTAGKAVRLHVDQRNPARRLYERLGFRTVEERPPYQFMEARPLARLGD